MVDLVRMQGVINCVVAYSRGFIHPPLTFQKGKVKVWLRVDNSTTNPIMVKVEPDTVVYEALLAAKPKLSLKNHPLDQVTVNFSEQVIPPDAQISQYSTSAGNPLLLELLEPEGKLHAVMYIALQVLGEPCNLHSGCCGVEPGSTMFKWHPHPGSRSYSDFVDTWADSVCIHQLILSLFKGCLYK